VPWQQRPVDIGTASAGALFVVCFWAEDDWSSAKSNTAILMLHLFVAPTPFEGRGEYPYDGSALSQLLAVFIVILSVGSLALALCLLLLNILAGEPLGNPFGVGPGFPITPLA
jgi:hypothetical protein